MDYSYTYDDLIFLLYFIDFSTDAVSLSSPLSCNLSLTLPFVSSPMDTISESSMASAKAYLGEVTVKPSISEIKISSLSFALSSPYSRHAKSQ